MLTTKSHQIASTADPVICEAILSAGSLPSAKDPNQTTQQPKEKKKKEASKEYVTLGFKKGTKRGKLKIVSIAHVHFFTSVPSNLVVIKRGPVP